MREWRMTFGSGRRLRIARESKLRIIIDQGRFKSNASNKQSSITDLIPNLVAAVTFLTSFYYILNYQYYSYFFPRLSIPYRDISISSNFFMMEVLISFLVGLFLMIVWLPVISVVSEYLNQEMEFKGNNGSKDEKIKEIGKKVHDTISAYLWSKTNFPLAVFTSFMLCSGPALAILGLPEYLNKIKLTYILTPLPNIVLRGLIVYLIIIPSIYYLYKIYRKLKLSLVEEIQSLFKLKSVNKYKLVFILIYLVTYSFLISEFMGAYHADRLKEGTLWDNYNISIVLNSTSASSQTSSLIDLPYVMHYDSKYYMLKTSKSYTRGDVTEMLIIPDDQIKSVLIRYFPFEFGPPRAKSV